MNEKEFLSFIKEQGISENKSFGEMSELLSIKMAEFQDSPMYMEDGADEMQEKFDNAIDFAEKMQKERESGIALASDDEEQKSILQENKADVDKLKNRESAPKDATSTLVSSTQTALNAKPQTASNTNSSSSQVSVKWFFSINGSSNIDDLFAQALDAIKYNESNKADRILDSIISAEPRNPGAFLGKAFIQYGLKKVGDLETIPDNVASVDELKNNTNIRRAHDYGNPSQAAQIDKLLDDNKKFRDYVEAEKTYKDGKFHDAAKAFGALGGYKDSQNRVKECEDKFHIEDELKEDEEKRIKKASNKIRLQESLLAAVILIVMILLGPGIGNFKDADDEGWFPEIDAAIHRFIPVDVTSSEAYGRVYLGFGDLHVEEDKIGLPVFAPFAYIVSHGTNSSEEEKETVEYKAYNSSSNNSLVLDGAIVESSGVVFNSIGDVEELYFPVFDGEVLDGSMINSMAKQGSYKGVKVSQCNNLKKLILRCNSSDKIEIDDCQNLSSVVLSCGSQGVYITNCPSLKTIYIHTGDNIYISNCPNLNVITVPNEQYIENIEGDFDKSIIIVP